MEVVDRVGLVLLLCACGPDDEAVGGAEAGDTTTHGASTTGSDATSSRGSETSGSTSGGSLTQGGTGSASLDATDDADDGPKGDVGPCDFEAYVQLLASESIQPPMDCGAVTLDDSIDAWEDSQACALDAISSESPFLLMWEPVPVDAIVRHALVGAKDQELAMTFVEWSDEQGEITLLSYAIASVDGGCPPSVGQMCLNTVPGAKRATYICGGP